MQKPEAANEGSAQTCPMCGSVDVRVAEDVSDEVTVFACDDCDATWADRVKPAVARPDDDP